MLYALLICALDEVCRIGVYLVAYYFGGHHIAWDRRELDVSLKEISMSLNDIKMFWKLECLPGAEEGGSKSLCASPHIAAAMNEQAMLKPVLL